MCQLGVSKLGTRLGLNIEAKGCYGFISRIMLSLMSAIKKYLFLSNIANIDIENDSSSIHPLISYKLSYNLRIQQKSFKVHIF